MRTTRLISCLIPLLLIGQAAAALAQDTMQRRYPLAQGAMLTIDNQAGGAIRVEGYSGAEAVIEISSKADLKDFEITIEPLAGGLTIRTERKDQTREVLFGLLKVKNKVRHGVDFRLQVPDSTMVDLKTSGGGIELSTLRAAAIARTSGGSLHCSGISGPLEARTSGGHIELSEVSGGCLATTSGGSINAEGMRGTVTLKTSGGHITVRRADGVLEVGTSGGNINLEELIGQVQASTSGGGITLTMAAPPSGDCLLKSSGGGIHLALPRESNVNLIAKTSGGRVKLELPVLTEEVSHGSVIGKLGQGGPLVELRTSGGGITIAGR